MVGSACDLQASVVKLTVIYVLLGFNLDTVLLSAVPSPVATSSVSLPCLLAAIYVLPAANSDGYSFSPCPRRRRPSTSSSSACQRLHADGF
jgi:hypothetical protein